MAQAKHKKRFFNVEIPLIKKETQLQAYEIEELNGRYINYDLTRLMRGKSILLQSKVTIKDKEASTIPTQIILLPYYLKRMVRKGTNYVEDSFSVEINDSIIRIKPFLVTRRKVSRAVRRALRNKAKEEITNYVKTKDSEELFREILKNSLQKSLSLKLKKIYPLSTCEIRILKIEKFLENPKKKEKISAQEEKEEAEIETKEE